MTTREFARSFLQGKALELLNELGIPYGYIFIEGRKPVFLINLQQVGVFLERAMEEGLLTSDDAASLADQVKSAKFVADLPAFFKRIGEYQLPRNRPGAFYFKSCEHCERNPLPHGNIVNLKDEAMTSVNNICEAFDRVLIATEENKISMLDGIAIIKQALIAKLPMDDEAWHEAFAALPETERNAFVARFNERRKSQLTDLVASMPPDLKKHLGL